MKTGSFGEKREMCPKAKSGMKGLIAIVRQLEKIKQEARALGIFTEDRKLLECPDCGLMEDVTINGLLITYPRNSSLIEDSGLRFVRIDETRYTCPACGATVPARTMGKPSNCHKVAGCKVSLHT